MARVRIAMMTMATLGATARETGCKDGATVRVTEDDGLGQSGCYSGVSGYGRRWGRQFGRCKL